MQEFFSMNYEWLRALHLIAIIAWMAGLFYLPRLFVYHAERGSGAGEPADSFMIMEYKLMKIIMNPAMIVSWILGLLLLYANPAMLEDGWMHVKLTAAVALSGYQAFLSVQIRKFAEGENIYSGRFYRWMNEVPTVLMILIVIMAVIQPF